MRPGIELLVPNRSNSLQRICLLHELLLNNRLSIRGRLLLPKLLLLDKLIARLGVSSNHVLIICTWLDPETTNHLLLGYHIGAKICWIAIAELHIGILLRYIFALNHRQKLSSRWVFKVHYKLLEELGQLYFFFTLDFVNYCHQLGLYSLQIIIVVFETFDQIVDVNIIIVLHMLNLHRLLRMNSMHPSSCHLCWVRDSTHIFIHLFDIALRSKQAGILLWERVASLELLLFLMLLLPHCKSRILWHTSNLLLRY